MPDLDRADLLLDLLNSAPVVGAGAGAGVDDLLDTDARAREWARSRGGAGTPVEAAHLRAARGVLQEVVRDRRPAADLQPFVDGVTWRPEIGAAGLRLYRHTGAAGDADRLLAVAAVLAWGALAERMPGRLRPCANGECHLFLLDRSRANTARWCSMRSCGNRMKARRHHARETPGTTGSGTP
ncbi:hypothetical protein AFB00_22390 [Pseudonocardia sp. HH130630-07]|nr:hypothetical protein AFB00_22390 [Pseudonocardia sp. HH130630-07]